MWSMMGHPLYCYKRDNAMITYRQLSDYHDKKIIMVVKILIATIFRVYEFVLKVRMHQVYPIILTYGRFI